MQWQEVNSLLEDEIGRMRAQLIKSRSIRRENQATVDKLKRDLAASDDSSSTPPIDSATLQAPVDDKAQNPGLQSTPFISPLRLKGNLTAGRDAHS
jgi:hypothetical protein